MADDATNVTPLYQVKYCARSKRDASNKTASSRAVTWQNRASRVPHLRVCDLYTIHYENVYLNGTASLGVDRTIAKSVEIANNIQ
jgi:hypothetical protein